MRCHGNEIVASPGPALPNRERLRCEERRWKVPVIRRPLLRLGRAGASGARVRSCARQYLVSLLGLLRSAAEFRAPPTP